MVIILANSAIRVHMLSTIIMRKATLSLRGNASTSDQFLFDFVVFISVILANFFILIANFCLFSKKSRKYLKT